MTFETGNTLSRCAGNNHLAIAVTIAGVTKTLHTTLDELRGEPPEDLQEVREQVLTRLRSAAKEANATTFAQLRTALESKTFKV